MGRRLQRQDGTLCDKRGQIRRRNQEPRTKNGHFGPCFGHGCSAVLVAFILGSKMSSPKAPECRCQAIPYSIQIHSTQNHPLHGPHSTLSSPAWLHLAPCLPRMPCYGSRSAWKLAFALDPEHSARLLQWIVAAPIVLKYQARPPVCLIHLYPTITTISHPPIIHDEIQHGFLSPPRRL